MRVIKRQSFLITAFLLELFAQEKMRYDDYKVYTVLPINAGHIDILKTLQQSRKYNFWTEIQTVGRAVDVMLPPEQTENFLDIVSSHKIPNTLMIHNVQEKIEHSGRKRRSTFKTMDWYDYHNGAEVIYSLFL